MSNVSYQLLTRSGCHLCHEMEKLLATVMPRYGESYVVADVDSDPEWRRRFGEVIPVLLRDGKPVAKIRVDQRRLEKIVGRTRARPARR